MSLTCEPRDQATPLLEHSRRGRRARHTSSCGARTAPEGARPSATLGLAIRRARAGRYTMAELARRSGTSIGLLSMVERGQGNPSFETLVRIADALDVPLAELVRSAEAGTGAGVPFETGGGRASDLSAEQRDAAASGDEEAVPGPRRSLERERARDWRRGWCGSVVLTASREARIVVSRGALELTIRDRSDELGTDQAAPNGLAISVQVRDTRRRGGLVRIGRDEGTTPAAAEARRDAA